MSIQQEYFEEFLTSLICDVYDAKMTLEDGTATIRFEAGHPVDIEDMENIIHVFGSDKITIPAWDFTPGHCDTCDAGSIALLDGFIIKDCVPFQEMVKRAAVIKWEREINRNLQIAAAREEARCLEKEREKQYKKNIAKQKRDEKIRQERQELLKNDTAAIFDKVWEIYHPIKDFERKEFAQIACSHSMRKILFFLRKSKNCSHNDHFHHFEKACRDNPKEMIRSLRMAELIN